MLRYETQTKSTAFLSSFLLFPFVVTFLFFSVWFYGLTRFQDQLITEILLFALFLGTLPFLPWREWVHPGRNIFDFWALTILGIAGAYVFFSVLPYQSFLAFVRLLGWVIFYGFLRGLSREPQVRTLLFWAVVILGVFYSAYGLGQYYGGLPRSFWYQPFSLASRYVNGGHFASLLLFPLFLGLALMISNRTLRIQVLLGALLAVISWAFVLTRARAAWIGFVIGSLLFLFGAGRKHLIRGRTWGSLVFLLGAVILVLFGAGGWEEVANRFKGLGSVVSSGLSPEPLRFYNLVYRFKIWEGAWRVITASPLGWGLGVFSSIFPQYQVHFDRFLVDYAHNEFLQIGVDLGFPGVLLVIGFITTYLRSTFKFLARENQTVADQAAVLALVSIFVSLLLVSQVDFPLRISGTSFFFATCLGMSACLFESSPSGKEGDFVMEQKRGRKMPEGWIRAGVFVFVLAVALLTGSQLVAEVHYQAGKRLDANFEWPEAQKEYEKTVRWAPFHSPYYEGLASFYHRRAAVYLDRNEKKKGFERALWAYGEAIRLQPYRASNHYRLALFYEQRGEVAHARSQFIRAIELEPHNGRFLLEFGYFSLKHHSLTEAIDALERFKEVSYSFREGLDAHICNVVRACSRHIREYHLLSRVITDDIQAHRCLAEILAEWGEWDWVKVELDHMLESAARDPDPKMFQRVQEEITHFDSRYPRKEFKNSVTQSSPGVFQ